MIAVLSPPRRTLRERLNLQLSKRKIPAAHTLAGARQRCCCAGEVSLGLRRRSSDPQAAVVGAMQSGLLSTKLT